MEETPGHRADVVEEMGSGFGSAGIDDTGTNQECEVSVDLFG